MSAPFIHSVTDFVFESNLSKLSMPMPWLFLSSASGKILPKC